MAALSQVWVSDGLYVGANSVRPLINGRTLFAPTYIIPKHKKEPIVLFRGFLCVLQQPRIKRPVCLLYN